MLTILSVCVFALLLWGFGEFLKSCKARPIEHKSNAPPCNAWIGKDLIKKIGELGRLNTQYDELYDFLIQASIGNDHAFNFKMYYELNPEKEITNSIDLDCTDVNIVRASAERMQFQIKEQMTELIYDIYQEIYTEKKMEEE